MTLTQVILQHFRNATQKTFTITDKVTVIAGENAKGKTNILEAIFLLSTGESFRAQRTEEMVQLTHEVGRVLGNITDAKGNKEELEVILTTGKVQGARTLKRQYRLDGAPKRKKDIIGKFHCVLFRPEDMDLIAGSPSLRRAYINIALSQTDMQYRESLDSYEKALKRRNALLDLLRESRTNRESFSFWDQLLIRHGNVLTQKRREFLEFLQHLHVFPYKIIIEYLPSTISEARLKQYEQEEIMAGHTLVGPHKDDFRVILSQPSQDKDLALYGSRGEQRMGVLWLKIGELEYYEKQLKHRPLLLLDDIFSELDEKHRQMVLSVIDKQQTIITTTQDSLPLFKETVFDMIQL